jgi:hypothetical protein
MKAFTSKVKIYKLPKYSEREPRACELQPGSNNLPAHISTSSDRPGQGKRPGLQLFLPCNFRSMNHNGFTCVLKTSRLATAHHPPWQQTSGPAT